ncbi:hypothetical protein ACE41B_29435 [Bacillus cereus]|uniref:hypothetical protein n=1 Tax=Bacillus cereus TaxID=1396 RepID=UPI0035CA5B41
MDLKEIDNQVGVGTLDTIIATDPIIRRIRYEEITRERDLDKVKTSTNKETEEENAEKKEKKIKRKSHDIEL